MEIGYMVESKKKRSNIKDDAAVVKKTANKRKAAQTPNKPVANRSAKASSVGETKTTRKAKTTETNAKSARLKSGIKRPKSGGGIKRPETKPKGEAAGAQSKAETDWARSVVNQLIEAQKTWLEITTKQYELVFKTVSDVTGMAENAPSKALADWAKEGVKGFIDAQQQWSEIALSQGEQVLKLVQTGDFANANVLDSIKSSAEQGVETVIGLRMAWLDFASKQNSQMIKVFKQGLNLDESSPAAALADFAESAMNSYVEIQKRWLEMATQLSPLKRKGE
ncbi:MAG: hypothetical protein ACK5NT_06900 [Pyrinomonadaceae bacterium]